MHNNSIATSPSFALHRRSGGFTLVELLVVIGIIAILIGILMPIVSAVRKAANIANTQNEIMTIGRAIDSYYSFFKAYPGPIGETDLIDATNGSGNNFCTSSQNLVWGLEGGWEPFNSTGAYGPHFSSSAVGQGAMSFNNATLSSSNTSSMYTPRYQYFLDTSYLMPQPWQSSSGDPYGVPGSPQDPTTSLYAPVYVDRFPARKPLASPILYLRAHSGVVGTSTTTPQICTFDTVVGNSTIAQYDNAELKAYKSLYNELGQGKPPNNPNTGKPDYPSWTAYFEDPATVSAQSGLSVPMARHSDSYLLISPAYDGVFGTADDISN